MRGTGTSVGQELARGSALERWHGAEPGEQPRNGNDNCIVQERTFVRVQVRAGQR